MSNSNSVRISYLKEVAYNQPPAAGNYRTVRHTTDTLSGTPRTTLSQEVREDRQNAGQIITGLDVTGAINFELSNDTAFKDFIGFAMLDLWNAPITTGVADLTIDTTGGTITRAAGDFVADGFAVNDMVQLAGFADANNNTIVLVTAITATVLTFVGGSKMVDEAGTGDETATRGEYVEIGTDRQSVSIEKDFTELTNKTIAYTGMRVGQMDLNFQFGQIVTGAFTFNGAGHDTPVTPITDSHTIDPAGTDQPMNAASDIGMVIIDGALTSFCINTLNISLNNNMQSQECIGTIAPTDQVSFTADVNITMNAYLADSNFDYISKKITQTPVSIVYFVEDENGNAYAVQVPAAQLTFSDPGNPGKDQFVMLNMTGIGKKDDTFGNSLRITKF